MFRRGGKRRVQLADKEGYNIDEQEGFSIAMISHMQAESL